mgnify:FL=1
MRFSSFKDYGVTVSLIGKPNVGKSTLLNKMSLLDVALAHPTPGLTRDGRSVDIMDTLDIPIKVKDTPGIQILMENGKVLSRFSVEAADQEFESNTELISEMFKKTKEAVEESDCVFLMIDGKRGVSSEDRDIKNWIGKNFKDKPVFLIVNKIESEEEEIEIYNEAYQLYRDNVYFVSSENGRNLHDLWSILDRFVSPAKKEKYKELVTERKQKIFKAKQKFMQEFDDLHPDIRKKFDRKDISNEFDYLNKKLIFCSQLDLDNVNVENILLYPKVWEQVGLSYYNKYKNLPIKVALIGRPHSGKSTLFNSVLG